MSEKTYHSIIIIGAGPSALALAHHLTDKGHRPLLLEAGDSSGFSWGQMPDFLSLVTFWKSNYLLKKDRFKFTITKQTPALEYADYLKGLSDYPNIEVKLNTKVTNIEKREGLFQVETSRGNYSAQVVINATGYYNSPFTPNYPGLEQTKMLNLHFRDYKNPESIKGKKNILVVGARLSAGQLLVDLKDEDVNLSLSTRSNLEYMSVDPILKFFLFIVDHIEKPMQSFSEIKSSTSAPMPHEAKKLISSGHVKVLPAIKSIHQESVSFEDGKTEPFDAILFATGFKPQFPHLNTCIELDKESLPKLSDGFEALYCENLFFLGLDHQNNIQSRFLRGIRNDAKELAAKVHKRLNV